MDQSTADMEQSPLGTAFVHILIPFPSSSRSPHHTSLPSRVSPRSSSWCYPPLPPSCACPWSQGSVTFLPVAFPSSSSWRRRGSHPGSGSPEPSVCRSLFPAVSCSAPSVPSHVVNLLTQTRHYSSEDLLGWPLLRVHFRFANDW